MCYYIIVQREHGQSPGREKGEQMEDMAMSAREILNLIDWLRNEGYGDDKVVECIEAVEGRKSDKERGKEKGAE